MLKPGVLVMLILLLQTVALSAQSVASVHEGQKSDYTEPSSAAASVVVSPLSDASKEAMLSDSAPLYRICNSRPQRLLSYGGTKNVKQKVRPSAQRATLPRLVQRSTGMARCSSPLRNGVSCRYYVFALRHILC